MLHCDWIFGVYFGFDNPMNKNFNKLDNGCMIMSLHW